MPIDQEIYDIGEESICKWQYNKLYILRTPLVAAKKAGKQQNAKVYFKLENRQMTGSYHFRGAIARMIENPTKKPFVTASTGNHAIGAALAAHAFGAKVTIVMPNTVEPHKLEKVRRYGAEIVHYGDNLNDARAHANDLAQLSGHTYFSPYDDRHVICGLGTVAVEILQQFETFEKPIHNIFVPMGGGALISGIGCFAKEAKRIAGKERPQVKVWGVTAINSMTLAASLSAGFVVETETFPTIAEPESNDITRNEMAFRLAKTVVDHVIPCTEQEILIALRQLALQEKQYVDGFSALALAGFNKVAHKLTGQTSAVVLCSGNYDREKWWKLVYGV
ncbi:ILV1-Anabolic serine and threonine dehydratase precursor [Fusarium austroafricanum]|uniref:ILV1-Anabolic serine and threonine dehydratase n=1 Tax=Fusarium austroafricanum TaxID=2364996 RepID=A0A8H4JYJ4_9HYPO|nr:ILV1-Anabolic serine and threonine dehydratase precursor [Fusarium austroafricanum]